jgi:hypothetical protein
VALTIEIWRSTSGVSEAAFTLLATIPDPGSGFTYDDTSVTPGSLYIYRARRRDDSLPEPCQYSDWTALAFHRAPYPFKESNMSCENDIVTGVETELFVAVEACQGIPTKVDWLAEYRSGGLNRDLMRLFGRSLHNKPTMRRKVVAGRAVWEGQIVLEITPEGAFPRFALATLPVETTALSSPTRYSHRFANKFGAKSITLIQRKGQSLFVYPGTMVSSLEVSFSKEQDDVLIGTFTIVALDEIVYKLDLVPTAPTLLGTATASSDPLPPYSPVTGVATIGGVVAGIKTITFTLNKNLGADNVFDGKRGARSHFERLADTSGSASLNYTSDNVNLERDFGVSNPSGAYAPGDTITSAPVLITFTPPNNGSGFSNLLTFCFPQADVKSAEPVEGENEVPENLTFTPLDVIGEAADTDFITGALADIERTITDYTGSTRQFTVGVAFGSAPVAGDLFEII